MIEYIRRKAKEGAKPLVHYLIDWMADLAKQAPKTHTGRPRTSYRDRKVAALIARFRRKEKADRRNRRVAQARAERKQRIADLDGKDRKKVSLDVAAKLAKAIGCSEKTAYGLVTRSK